MKDRMRAIRRLGPDSVLVERQRNGERSTGVLAPLRDGQTLAEGTELVTVDTSGESEDGWRDASTIYTVRATSDGPAQVATPAYREGYDRIFGKKPTVGLA